MFDHLFCPNVGLRSADLNWLVVSTHLNCWDDSSQYLEKCSKPPTSECFVDGFHSLERKHSPGSLNSNSWTVDQTRIWPSLGAPASNQRNKALWSYLDLWRSTGLVWSGGQGWISRSCSSVYHILLCMLQPQLSSVENHGANPVLSDGHLVGIVDIHLYSNL